MPNTLSPYVKQQFLNNQGQPNAGGYVYTYAAGTTTPAATYTSTGATNANPVILNSRGECDLWIPPNVGYKFMLTDRSGNAIWTIDNIINSQMLTLYGGVSSGSTNAYTLSFAANFSSYTDGIAIYWIPSFTNTVSPTPVTINVNGLGPVSIVNQDGSNLAAGQLPVNNIAFILYKAGTGFLLSSIVGGSGNVQAGGINVTGSGIPANGIYLPTANTLGFSTNTTQQMTIGPTGALTINAPTSAVPALSVFGQTPGTSLGIYAQAGASAADYAMSLVNASGSTVLAKVYGDGGMTLGTATEQGLGTLNAASGLYVAGFPAIYTAASSLIANGYIKLSNGLIFQWGTNSITTPVSFPLTFPAHCWSVQLTLINTGPTTPATGVISVSTSAFTPVVGGSGYNYYWFAVGN